MTYIYQYKVNGVLWYIGKGNNGRDKAHIMLAKLALREPKNRSVHAWHRDLGEAIERGDKIEIERLHDNLTDGQAAHTELALIRKLKPVKNTARKPGTARQTTRLLKLQCSACGYVVRTTRKWVQIGLPVCCCGTVLQIVDDRSGDLQ